jgi:iron complex transport system ATP-binding protein
MNALLQLENLTISIAGRQLIQDLNLVIKPAENWCILGQNGQGKTTLLNTLCGLHDAERGNIKIAGEALEDYPPRDLARLVGYLMQSMPGDFPQTVYQFCSTGLHPHLNPLQGLSDSDHEKILAALTQVDLQGYAQRNLAGLSGGEKRRAEIANLLIQQPKIWLLDEPVNHLDIAHQIGMLKLLTGIATENGGSVISVLHDPNLAERFFSHVLLLYPDGSYQSGKSADCLNEENLGRLFGYPIKQLVNEDTRAFLPA